MSDHKRSQEIQQIVQTQGIEFLGHFTVLDNLPSIVQYGLLPGNHISEIGIDRAYCSDIHRLDDPEGRRGRPLCFTPSGINRDMIMSKKRHYPDVEWAFISVPSSIMWTHWCEFFLRKCSKKAIS